MLSAVYLISSLPTLSFGEKPPISMDEFMHDVSLQLSKKKAAKVEQINIQHLDKNSISRKLNSMIAFQNDMQYDLEVIRKAERANSTPNIKSLSKTIVDSNPLEREELLMKLLWDALSSIEFVESFTLTEIMIYKLKLQILERLHSFDADKGKAVFDSVVNPQTIEIG